MTAKQVARVEALVRQAGYKILGAMKLIDEIKKGEQ